MKRFIIRLDDACEHMDQFKWGKIEKILDEYSIKPIVGIIPNCCDKSMMIYERDDFFWEKVNTWVSKEWIIAMHGYDHVYITDDGGINPVNRRSEFAGVAPEIQEKKIISGYDIFVKKNIYPKVFFAPSHTYDENTLTILKEKTDIRVISDTIANDIYTDKGLVFIPVQSGKVRKLPFKTVTYCLHPNTMCEADFEALKKFILKNYKFFKNTISFETKRKYSIFDKILRFIYFKIWRKK